MASACCTHWSCPCEQLIKPAAYTQETGSHPDHTDSVTLPTNMDIAVLKEQYNSIREKQRHETRVICFRKESDNEDICGKTLVNLVSMRQDQPSLMRQASLQDNRVDFNRDPDSATWRTHLIMYRRSCLTSETSQPSKVNTSTKDTTSSASIEVNSAECSLEEADLSHQLSKDCDETETGSLLVNKELNNCESKNLRFRKCSAPVVLTRQLSCGSYPSGHNPESPCYYPFPQLKSPRKSEAARRLGLYSSF